MKANFRESSDGKVWAIISLLLFQFVQMTSHLFQTDRGCYRVITNQKGRLVFYFKQVSQGNQGDNGRVNCIF